MSISKQEALDYHQGTRPGKVEVVSSKPCRTPRDLSLAYTPGVAQPCLEIEKNSLNAYKYTAKGNLVAVVSNGTAVLGLGDIGALAGKPVMEGKGVFFKRFAHIDIELNTHNAVSFRHACVSMGWPIYRWSSWRIRENRSNSSAAIIGLSGHSSLSSSSSSSKSNSGSCGARYLVFSR